MLCTADTAAVACYDTAAPTAAPKAFITTTVAGPYGWDVTQDGRVLLAIAPVTDAASGTTPRGVRLTDVATGQALGQIALETYAIATSPDSRTATLLTLDPTDTATQAQERIPFNLVKIDLATRTVASTVPLRDQAGARLAGPWTVYGLADTGADLVIWNGDATAAVLVVSAAGTLQRRIAAPATNFLILSPDSTQAYVANGSKAQRLDLTTGTVVADYVYGNYDISSVTLSPDGAYVVAAGTDRSLGGDFTGLRSWKTGDNAFYTSIMYSVGGNTVGGMMPVRRPPPPKTGWWWDPARSGAGYAIEVQNGKAFIGTFSYETDGRPTWFVTSCALDAHNVCAGKLDRYTGGTTLGGAYKAAAYAGSAGPVVLTVTAPDRATLAIQGRAEEITRLAIDPGAGVAAAPAWAPPAGWWWSATEPGVGWFLESQGAVTYGVTYSQMYLVGYMYGSDGGPVWYASKAYYSQLPTAGGATPYYQGELLEFAGGPPYAGGAGGGTTVTAARGYVTVQFLSQTEARLLLPSGRSVALTRFVLP